MKSEPRDSGELHAELVECLTPLTDRHRLAFLAALAERWFPAYEAFSVREAWGSPGALRGATAAVWDAAVADTVEASSLLSRRLAVEDVTPHMGDFDGAEGALIACVLCYEALDASLRDEVSASLVADAAVGVFTGLMPDVPYTLEEERARFAEEPQLGESQALRSLARFVASLPDVNGEAIEGIREAVDALPVARTQAAHAAAPPEGAPVGASNRDFFFMYRRILEHDLRDPPPDPGEGEPFVAALQLYAAWAQRYGRRRQILGGDFGRHADEAGWRAVLERNRALNAASEGAPDWGEEVATAVAMAGRNDPSLAGDADAADAPHAYGPSLRRVWLTPGIDDGPRRVAAWAARRPPAWDTPAGIEATADEVSAEVAAALARDVRWSGTGDPLLPWVAHIEGSEWRVRVNDFPEEPMYGLVVDGRSRGDFHDWPATWRRP